MSTDTNPAPVRITRDLLVAINTCALDDSVGQIDDFAGAFPDGLVLTPEPDEDAVALIVDSFVDTDELCRRVLNRSARGKYASAVETAWAEYERTIDEAWANSRSDPAQYGHAVDRGRDERARAFVRAAWHALADRKNWWPRYYWHLL